MIFSVRYLIYVYTTIPYRVHTFSQPSNRQQEFPAPRLFYLLMTSHSGRKLDGVLKSRATVLPQQRTSEAQPSNVAGELMTFNSTTAIIPCKSTTTATVGFINRVLRRGFVSQLEPHSFFSARRSVDRCCTLNPSSSSSSSCLVRHCYSEIGFVIYIILPQLVFCFWLVATCSRSQGLAVYTTTLSRIIETWRSFLARGLVPSGPTPSASSFVLLVSYSGTIPAS